MTQCKRQVLQGPFIRTARLCDKHFIDMFSDLPHKPIYNSGVLTGEEAEVKGVVGEGAHSDLLKVTLQVVSKVGSGTRLPLPVNPGLFPDSFCWVGAGWA